MCVVEREQKYRPASINEGDIQMKRMLSCDG